MKHNIATHSKPNSKLLEAFFTRYGNSFYAIDEVGRGSLFGPVTLGGVFFTREIWEKLKTHPLNEDIRDSKLVKKSDREKLASALSSILPFAIAHVSAKIIDRDNINRAIQRGVYRVIQKLSRRGFLSPVALLDGNYRFSFPSMGMDRSMPELVSIPKADQNYLPVACASILAKVKRDEMVTLAARRFIEYRLEQNMGYGTAVHRAAILEYGMTRHHRRSFCGNFFQTT